MPELVEFPHCCTAKIMVDFGESFAAEGGYYKLSLEEMEVAIRAELVLLSSNIGMVTVTTNDAQKTANTTLLKLGFEHSPWIYKNAHINTRIRLWWLDMGNYRGNADLLKRKNKAAKALYTTRGWRN